MKNILICILCLFIPLAFASIARITPQESNDLIDKNNAILVDVREPKETALGIAKNAYLLPKSIMDKDRNSFIKETSKFPKNKTLIVYCGTGKRANIVGIELEKLGFKVLNMGGFNSWKEAGMPIETR